MAFYVGQRKEHKDGRFSFWISDVSLDFFFGIGKVVVVFLGILAAIASLSPLIGYLILFGIAFAAVKFFVNFLQK